MSEFGKRGRPYWGDEENRSHKRRNDRGRERDDRGNDDLVVYRILCPDGIIGSVIGKNGKVINSIRQDTGAKVKVIDPFPCSKDRVVTVYCYVREREDIDVEGEFYDNKPLCAAQDALLKVHAAIANAGDLHRESDKKRKDKDKEECRLLVPSSQSASIIGKSGAIIKKLRTKTKTNIKVIPKDSTDPDHTCALEFDNFVLISGASEAVKRALFAVSTIMYKFTPRESIPLETSIPNAPPSIIIPSDVPLYPATELYSSVASLNPDRSVAPILGPSGGADISGYADSGSTWPLYSSAVPLFSGFSGVSRSELNVKLLCPSSKIGRIIGKGGNTIRNIRQDSGAIIEIGDHKANYDECIITVISKESTDDLKSVAVEAVLLLQGKMHDEDQETVTMRLLIPSKVIGCIIGKSGSIINEIRKRTRADILISKGKKPKFADEDDELVEIKGQLGNVRDALVQIVLNLREDVLKDRDSARKSSAVVEPLYGGGQAVPMQSILRSMPSGAPVNYEHRVDTGGSLGLLPSTHYGYGSLSLGDDAYGSLSSNPSALYSRLPPPSTLEMIIPANAVGKVIGKGGANIDNIRKISRAAIEISDSRSSRGDRIALISGTSEEKKSAENLIQAFIMSA